MTVLVAIATWALLVVLNGKPGLRQTKLAEIVHKDKTTVTRMLDVLERKCLIRKSAAPDDRRAFMLELTPTGTRLVERMLPVVATVEADIAGILNAKEVEELSRILEKLRQGL